MTKITLVIPDDFETSVEQFLSSQVINEAHPVTGAPIMRPIYPTKADWAETVFREKLAEIARLYPTDTIKAKIEERQRVEKELQDISKPGSLKPTGSEDVVVITEPVVDERVATKTNSQKDL